MDSKRFVELIHFYGVGGKKKNFILNYSLTINNLFAIFIEKKRLK